MLALLLSQFVLAQAQSPFELIVAHTSYKERNLRLLQIIMDQTVEKYGPYSLVKGPDMNRGRVEEEMRTGNIHIMWGTFSQKRLKKLKLRPLHGFVSMADPRVCLIKKGSQYKFNDIRTLADWNQKKLTTGVGTYWSDIPLYRKNRMLIESTPNSDLLYGMAANERFDCFNRGAEEVFNNLNKFSGFNLAIEEKLAFIFKGKYSGFLLPADNDYLYERMKSGIDNGWKNKAFDGFLKNELDQLRQRYALLHLEHRRFIVLDNPEAYDHPELRAINKSFIESFMKNLD